MSGRCMSKPKYMKSCSRKAGITFPVGRVHRLLLNGEYSENVGVGASIFMAKVLEYLVAEVTEVAGNAARETAKSLQEIRITSRHLQLAFRKDDELNKLLNCVITNHEGAVPSIQKEPLPKKTPKPNHHKGPTSQEL